MSGASAPTKYPDPVVFRGKLQDVGPALREEFTAVEAHCAKKSVPVSVAVEQLCVLNLDADRNACPGLGVFYPIPEDNKHRLLSSHSVLHYRWLCFSSPSKPTPVLGLEGDIWVNTTDDDQHVYYNTGIGWTEWSADQHTHHPFAKDLVLAYGFWKLGWFPLSDLDNVFPGLWKEHFDDDRKTRSPSVRTIVKELYEASGRPKRQERADAKPDNARAAPAAHECRKQVRSLKQWPAARTHFLFGSEYAQGDDERGGNEDYAPKEDELKFAHDIWDTNGTLIVIDSSEVFKFSGPLVSKYSKALKYADDGRSLGVLGDLPIYELCGETERGDLRVFLAAIKDIETNPDRTWTTKELTELIRMSRNCRLEAPRVKNFAKRELAKLWAPDLANLTPEPLPGVFEALLTVRWSKLPASLNRRAKYELVRDRDTRKKLAAYDASAAPQEWVISDRQLTQVFRARDYLQDAYRAFVAAPPPMLDGACPENTSAKRAARGSGDRDKNAGKCTATRRRYRTRWAEAVAAKLLSDECRHDPLCALDQIGAWAALGMCAACAEGVREHCQAQKEAWWEKLEEWFEPEDGYEEDDWIEPSHCGDNPEYDSDSSMADDAESEDDDEEEEDDDVEMVDAAPAPSGSGARVPAAPPQRQGLGRAQAASGRAVNAAIAQRASNQKIAGLPNKPSWVQNGGKTQNGGKKKKNRRKGGRP